jgi:hypothetical protein
VNLLCGEKFVGHVLPQSATLFENLFLSQKHHKMSWQKTDCFVEIPQEGNATNVINLFLSSFKFKTFPITLRLLLTLDLFLNKTLLY